MLLKEKYDKLMERMLLSENYDKRNPQIFSDIDLQIVYYMKELKTFLEKCENGIQSEVILAQQQFNCVYTKLVSLLDEQGWK